MRYANQLNSLVAPDACRRFLCTPHLCGLRQIGRGNNAHICNYKSWSAFCVIVFRDITQKHLLSQIHPRHYVVGIADIK